MKNSPLVFLNIQKDRVNRTMIPLQSKDKLIIRSVIKICYVYRSANVLRIREGVLKCLVERRQTISNDRYGKVKVASVLN